MENGLPGNQKHRLNWSGLSRLERWPAPEIIEQRDPGDLAADFAALIRAEKTIMFARYHESWRTDRRQASAQVELGHASSDVAKRRALIGAKTRAQASNAARP